VRDSGDGRAVVDLTDGSSCGPFEIASGPAGPQGEPGPPGEVTNQQLNDAIASTSANTNAVATLDTPYDDPEKETLRQKLNELINAQRR